jgi:hypothetical protein
MRPETAVAEIITAGPEGEDRASMAGKKPSRKQPAPTKSTARQDKSGQDVGRVLKNVYQRAVEEDIPAEMLDLLGKLD